MSASAIEPGGDDDGERCIQDDRILSDFADMDRFRGWLLSPSLLSIGALYAWGRAVRIVLCLLVDGRMIRRPGFMMANDGEG
jgi:hypothetical protein